MQTDELIKLDGVEKHYGTTRVLEPVHLTIKDGEFITILGPSGSGKTTILRMIGGFTPPTAGRILFEGQDITTAPIFLRPFNTVFQDYALFPHMTVAANVGYGLSVRGRPRAEIERKVAQVLATVDLTARAKRYPSELSGGQRQRVALARAIVCEPRVILLDEPLAALDAEMRRSMQDFLKNLQRQIKTTFVFITHDQQEAVSMSDRIVVMDHGKIEQVGTPREIYFQPRSEFVAKFFGENNLFSGVAQGSGLSSCWVSQLGKHGSLPNSTTLNKQEATLAIRPESLRVTVVPDSKDEHHVAVKINSVTFLGSNTQLDVAVAHSGLALRVVTPTPQLAPGLCAGADAFVSWGADSVSVVA
jgi:spermidine/putrescine transport system ATP-binding protein